MKWYYLCVFLLFLVIFRISCHYRTGGRKVRSVTISTVPSLKSWVDTCLASVKDMKGRIPLAPFTFQGRVQVDINDAFGQLVFCLSLLPNVNDLVDIFVFSGSGSTWIASQSFFLKQKLSSGDNYKITGWEGSSDKFALAQENLKTFSNTVKYNLHNEFTLQRSGDCDWKRCNLSIKLPLEGGLLDYCKQYAAKGKRVSMSIHDGDVAHGFGDLHEWRVVNEYCKPTFVSLFNTNIHPTHKVIVCELSKHPDWMEIRSGWVPFDRHPRYKNRTYHAFVNIKRYTATSLLDMNKVVKSIEDGVFDEIGKQAKESKSHSSEKIRSLIRPRKQNVISAVKSKDVHKSTVVDLTPEPIDENLQKFGFDMMTILKTPTCVNYYTVTNAIKYLKSQGLRKVFVVTRKKWMAGISQWGDDIVAVDEDAAIEGISYSRIGNLLKKYGFTDEQFQGRTSAGWYLVQFLNLAFVLRDDVSDILLLQDADQMILPRFKMFGAGSFVGVDGKTIPRMSVKVGGGKNNVYDYAMKCLTGLDLLFPKTGGSYVTHSWVAYKPILKEMLAAFEKSSVNKNAAHDVPESEVEKTIKWLEKSVQCINPRSPHLGYGESANYLTWIIRKHPEMVDIQGTRTWIRNLGGEASKTKPGESGYCCPDKSFFDTAHKRGYEYTGIELGHQYNNHCGYTSEKFKDSPYPPRDDVFWARRGISWPSE
eukprot:g4376.t1